jgi:hypothetical protein
MITFPVGLRTPPWKAGKGAPVMIFVVARVRGLRTTTLDPEGIKHTLPSGVGTAPRNPEKPNALVENRPVAGLKNPS